VKAGWKVGLLDGSVMQTAVVGGPSTAMCRDDGDEKGCTYMRCFFFGPGLPRGLGPSTAEAPLLVPALTLGAAFFLPFASVAGGASRALSTPSTGVAASAGASRGVGSTTWAGVLGDDDGLSDDFDDGSWGNLASASGDSGSLTSRDFVFAEDMAPAVRATAMSSGGGGNKMRGRQQRRGCASAWWWW
jgi:hypothetical protein